MIQCVDCASFTLRDVGEMARRGCGRCEHDARYTYFSALREHVCNKFNPVKAEVADKRREWLSK